jgi:hypothetical protein
VGLQYLPVSIARLCAFNLSFFNFICFCLHMYIKIHTCRTRICKNIPESILARIDYGINFTGVLLSCDLNYIFEFKKSTNRWSI